MAAATSCKLAVGGGNKERGTIEFKTLFLDLKKHFLSKTICLSANSFE